MRYKRRFVTVYRDFPEGCGVPSRPISNSDGFFKQCEIKAHGGFPEITKVSSDHSETETSSGGVKDNSRDVSTEDGSILESSGGVKDHQEEEGIGESEDKLNQTSLAKKRCLSSHNSTMEVGTDVMDTSKRVIVSGIAAASKCPWRHPKNRGSRQDKRRWS